MIVVTVAHIQIATIVIIIGGWIYLAILHIQDRRERRRWDKPFRRPGKPDAHD